MPPQLKRALWIAGIGLAVFFGLMAYNRATSNSIDLRLGESAPFAVRFAITEEDGSLPVVGQAVFFPTRKRLLLYFANTDARFDASGDLLSSMSPSGADRFSQYTDLGSEYHLHISRPQLGRLLDLGEGLSMFLEAPLVFENARFQYPDGLRIMPGEQALEYALARRKMERGSEYLSGVERLYRVESLLLTLFWNAAEFAHKLDSAAVQHSAVGLLDTNMNPEELASLFGYIVGRSELEISCLELPLDFVPGPGGGKLLVKETRSRVLFSEFVENLNAGRLNQDTFPVEVLNGTEVGGQARRVKQFLQDRALPVLNAGNYPLKPLASSYIVDRSGNTYAPRRVLELTGMDRTRVAFGRAAANVSVSLLIGEDFNPKHLH
ncbi:MAG: LytR C-terminal domain-containing protein [Leptospirales bacterium]|nr:LytR C-terminal domain-containing protein [Leptospirales bacterium]